LVKAEFGLLGIEKRQTIHDEVFREQALVLRGVRAMAVAAAVVDRGVGDAPLELRVRGVALFAERASGCDEKLLAR
jgi:hypothetical protein